MKGYIMNIADALLTALFVMAVVFVTLIVLWVMLRLISGAVGAVEKHIRGKNSDAATNGS
jgi:Na+-transporting methylmalonyl-CoA/oxaloacetate decarboxylase gamma subunit